MSEKVLTVEIVGLNTTVYRRFLMYQFSRSEPPEILEACEFCPRCGKRIAPGYVHVFVAPERFTSDLSISRHVDGGVCFYLSIPQLEYFQSQHHLWYSPRR